MRILLDTNILLRQAEPLHAHHVESAAATDALRSDGNQLVIVPQVLYEFWSVATRPVAQNGLAMTAAEARGELLAIQRLFRLLRDERAIYAIWEELVASHGVHGKQVHDARLVAAMQRHSITHILTFNTADFIRFRSISVLSPTDVTPGA
jgi:predicted nucleic acid-binding protein